MNLIKKNKNYTMTDLFETIAKAINPLSFDTNKVVPCAAIHLAGRVNTSEGWKNKIYPSLKVAARNGVLLPDKEGEEWTHEITECYCNLLGNGNLSIDVRNLDTNEVANIRLSLDY